MHAETIKDLRGAVSNIIRYNADLKNGKGLAGQFRQVQHWYSVRDPKDQKNLLWGPAKFIGYANMTSDRYIKLARVPLEDGGLHGIVAKAALQFYFRQLDPQKDEDFDLIESRMAALESWASQYSKRLDPIRSSFGIHVVRDEFDGPNLF